MLSVTLKRHNQQLPTYNLPAIVYGTSIQMVMDNFNRYRGPDAQIGQLYNFYGQEIPHTMWKLPIQENMVFFIDQPSN